MGKYRKTESTRTQSQWLYHPLCILSMIEDEMQQAKEKKSRPSVEWFVYVLLQKAT